VCARVRRACGCGAAPTTPRAAGHARARARVARRTAQRRSAGAWTHTQVSGSAQGRTGEGGQE
jgi:hypothetical protein